MNKTDNADHVGKHQFELAGLGKAPFRFIGMSENRFKLGDGTSKPGGSCDYCSAGIAFECHVRSADGREFKVGSDCIRKVGDEGLYRAFKTSPEYRKHQRDLRRARDIAVTAELESMLANPKFAQVLHSEQHPHGFNDRQTGRPLTYLDYILYIKNLCGAKGRGDLHKLLKQKWTTAGLS